MQTNTLNVPKRSWIDLKFTCKNSKPIKSFLRLPIVTEDIQGKAVQFNLPIYPANRCTIYIYCEIILFDNVIIIDSLETYSKRDTLTRKTP